MTYSPRADLNARADMTSPKSGSCCGSHSGNNGSSEPHSQVDGDRNCDSKPSKRTDLLASTPTSLKQSSCCTDTVGDPTHAHDHEKTVFASAMGDCCTKTERCDEQCIKSAAAIECRTACEEKEWSGCTTSDTAATDAASLAYGSCIDQGHHHHKHQQDGQHAQEACNTHLQAAFAKYAAYIEQARCICRNVLSAQSSQCCGASRPLLPSSGRSIKSLSRVSSARTSHEKMANKTIAQDPHGHSHHGNSAHGRPEAVAGCCSGHEASEGEKNPSASERARTIDDIERDGQTSHILLNVAGMDCTGCANNLARALCGVPGARNVQVVFVTGVAELDLDIETTTLKETIAIAERATHYKITPFSTDTQTLHVILATSAADALRTKLPRGIEGCDKIGKERYAVNYDPCIIGARNVLSASGRKLAPPADDPKVSAGKRLLIDKGIKTTLAFIFTIPVAAFAWGDPQNVSKPAKLWTSLALATVVQAIAWPEFYRPAISSLIYNRVVEMDMLVVISITAAYCYSVVAFGLELSGHALDTEGFFETSTLLIDLVLLGRFMACWARRRAIASVSMKSLRAETAMLLDSTGEAREVDARLLHLGDEIRILPHSKIVTDAVVVQGASEVDESMLTGESVPLVKKEGSPVIAGTINGDGTLTAKVSRLPGKNTIDDIENLVSQAQSSKPRIQDLADRVAGWFVPVVVIIAIIVCIVWAVIAVKIRKESSSQAAGTSLSYTIAVLAISCPCALGLAVPMVLVVAGGVAARGGIIIKSADVIERGCKVTDVVFDKTGTLTQSTMEVVYQKITWREDVDVMSLLKQLTADNTHPVSKAVAAALANKPSQQLPLHDLRSIPGAGIEATWAGHTIKAGNPTWCNVSTNPNVLSAASQNLTLFCLTLDASLLAIFGLKSNLRPETRRVITELHRRNITVHIVSGDGPTVVSEIASILHIPAECTAARQTPLQKRDYVKSLMTSSLPGGGRNKTVLFCGDGTNDAVAVAQADIGVQIESSSSDVTRATADVVLLSGLDGVVGVLDVSKHAYRRIVFNFVWSAVYNVVAVLAAGGGFVRWSVPPAYAGLGEIVSVAPVVVVAMTMPKVKVKVKDGGRV